MGATYAVAPRAFEVGFRVLGLDIRITGLDHLPADGPAILAANHVRTDARPGVPPDPGPQRGRPDQGDHRFGGPH